MSDRSFFFDVFLIGVACTTIYWATVYLFDKIEQHDDEIEKLSSRLEKYESSQDHELKK